jgi:hypothetical protein
MTIAGSASEGTLPRAKYTGRTWPRNADINVAMPTDNGKDEDGVTGIQHKQQKLSHLLRDDDTRWPSSSTENLSEAVLHHSGTSSTGDISVSLIIDIVQSLNAHGDIVDDYRILELELESLHQTLTLTSLAVQTYEYTPLGRNLANSIIPHVEQIWVVLRQLFDRIEGYRQGLNSTSIRAFWYRVWWCWCEVGEVASLRRKLSARQKLLDKFLMALNS